MPPPDVLHGDIRRNEGSGRDTGQGDAGPVEMMPSGPVKAIPPGTDSEIPSRRRASAPCLSLTADDRVRCQFAKHHLRHGRDWSSDIDPASRLPVFGNK
ncbi:hypothetical protein [Methanogenium cariaci]|uniref:hypothetical protein n=1 Tax=Methanogenium cariaci TaxID=2197 RepID=UPI001FDF22F0|nr:hypothetical protein [Methanogenium cariaci]